MGHGCKGLVAISGTLRWRMGKRSRRKAAPQRMERMVMRAYAEGEVTGTHAAELLGWSLEKVLGSGEEGHADSLVAEPGH